MVLIACVRSACKCQKMAALRIELFPTTLSSELPFFGTCKQTSHNNSHSIDAILTGFENTRQRNYVKVKVKIKALRGSFLKEGKIC